MPITASRVPGAGLSASDVETIREGLAAGRRPKVVFTASAGQMAGQVGQVVSLDDPAGTEEWLVVRFGSDELPFSPTDLAIPARGRAAGGATTARGQGRRGPAAGSGPAATPPAATRTATEPAAPVKPAAARAKPAAASRTATTSAAIPPEPEPAPRRAAKRTGRARPAKLKPPAAMTVTLAYEAGQWLVSAHQGSRTLAKPAPVSPGDALKMVAMLDVPGVHDAVEAIVAAELAEAQRRAEALRDQLAEVEARLAELRGDTR